MYANQWRDATRRDPGCGPRALDLWHSRSGFIRDWVLLPFAKKRFVKIPLFSMRFQPCTAAFHEIATSEDVH